ncbi:MAG: GPR endopeptidase [Bacilli bacterium]|nr:GPR endopeptidase [Bacilli bacterium]
MVSFFYEPRTDFAHELIDDSKQGYRVYKRTKNDILTTKVVIDKDDNSLRRKVGTYYSIEFDSISDINMRNNISEMLTYELKDLLRSKGFKYGDTVLIVGLGNKYVSADSLGPETALKVHVTNHLFEIDDFSLPKGSSRVLVLSPGVMGQTGMETSDFIKAINDYVKAKFIIVIDALASMNIKRINKMIQITDTGISPGSGIGNKRKGIDSKILKTNVIAIGVATVVEASNIIYQVLRQNNIKSNRDIENFLSQSEYQLVVTPKEIDEDINHLSEIISNSINNALNKNFAQF